MVNICVLEGELVQIVFGEMLGAAHKLIHPYLINARLPLILCVTCIWFSLNADMRSSELLEMSAPDPASIFR